jgi:hypothetical protein
VSIVAPLGSFCSNAAIALKVQAEPRVVLKVGEQSVDGVGYKDSDGGLSRRGHLT